MRGHVLFARLCLRVARVAVVGAFDGAKHGAQRAVQSELLKLAWEIDALTERMATILERRRVYGRPGG